MAAENAPGLHGRTAGAGSGIFNCGIECPGGKIVTVMEPGT